MVTAYKIEYVQARKVHKSRDSLQLWPFVSNDDRAILIAESNVTVFLEWLVL